MPKRFPHLLSPLQIGPKLLRNRVLITGHVPRLADNSLAGPRYAAYQRARARGGAGLQITGAQGVHVTGTLGTAYSLANTDDRVIDGYRLLADAVHAEGGAMLAQLAHSAATVGTSDAGKPLWAPSPVQSEIVRETPHEMTVGEIATIVQAFGAAAGRVRACGLDGVELLGAFGFLIAAFLSPFTNRRSDSYGGSLDNRMRFAHEVIEATRAAAGSALIVGMRIPGDELTEGGLGREEMREIAQRLAATGKLDYLNVIAGTNYARLPRNTHWAPTPSPHGTFVELAAGIKQVVKIPVLTTGRITDPELAESILARGLVDMVGMTRAHIADPEIVRKISEGRPDDIRPCVGANVCISATGGPLRCFHNPEVARETEWAPLERAAAPKRVAIVGGGPAGLEAARVAALRGHRVTLYEASDELGGRLRTWADGPLTKELGKAIDWRIGQLRKQQVEVRTGGRFAASEIAGLDCDVLVIATGSKPMPRPAALTSASTVPVTDPETLLRGPLPRARRAIVWDNSGGREGLTAAEALTEGGSEVFVVSDEFMIGEGLEPTVRTVVYRHLLGHGAKLRPAERIVGIDGRSARLRNIYSGAESTINEVDLIVAWNGRLALDELSQAAQDAGIRTITIGDAMAPRSVTQAIAEGALAARSI